MFDVVMPEGNEEAFIDMALSLGYKEICFLSVNPRYSYSSDRIRIKRALLTSSTNGIGKARKDFDLIFADAKRQFFESKVDYILDAEDHERKDSFHYRRTSLNQVHAKLARDNGITVVFSFRNLMARNRTQMLGRMMQNARLARKYKFKTQSFSLADDPMEMKSRNILDALLRVLGL